MSTTVQPSEGILERCPTFPVKEGWYLVENVGCLSDTLVRRIIHVEHKTEDGYWADQWLVAGLYTDDARGRYQHIEAFFCGVDQALWKGLRFIELDLERLAAQATS